MALKSSPQTGRVPMRRRGVIELPPADAPQNANRHEPSSARRLYPAPGRADHYPGIELSPVCAERVRQRAKGLTADLWDGHVWLLPGVKGEPRRGKAKMLVRPTTAGSRPAIGNEAASGEVRLSAERPRATCPRKTSPPYRPNRSWSSVRQRSRPFPSGSSGRPVRGPCS